MATVRLSDKVRDSIIENAKLLYHDEDNALSEEYKTKWFELAEEAYNKWLDTTEDGKLLKSLPDGWFIYKRVLKLSVSPSAGSHSYIMLSAKALLKDQKFRMPAYMMNGFSWDRKKHFSDKYESENAAVLPIVNAEVYYRAKKLQEEQSEKTSAFVNKRKEFVELVKETIDKCTTVNQLVKAWPAAERLLDDEHKARLARPNTRTSAKRIKQEIEADTQKLNQELLKKVL